MFIDDSKRPARTALLGLLFLLTILAPSIFAQSKEMPITGSKEAVALYLAARDKQENLEDPGTLFDQAVQKDPNFALAYLFAGRTNQEGRANLAKAVELADQVSPGEREWILSVRDQFSGNPMGRKQHLEQLLKLHPGDKRAHSLMGFYYRSVGDDVSSLRHFQQSVKLDKNYAPAYNNIGYSYLRMEKYDEAESAFKKYIQLIPKNPNPYDSYAELLMKSGKFDESIVQYNKALAIDPTFFNSYRGIGNNYVYKGDYAKARAAYKMMYDKAPDDAGRDLAMFSEMNSYVYEGKIDEALAVNERRRAVAERNSDAAALVGIHGVAGFIALEAGRYDDAAKHFALLEKASNDASLPAVSSPNRRFGVMQFNTRLMIARNDLDAAKPRVEELRTDAASRKNLNQERASNEVAGFYLLGMKDYAKAADAFAKGDVNDPYIWYYRAVALEGAGDQKSASEFYARVANWNSLDDTGHAFVRSRALQKSSLAKKPTN